MALAEKYPEEEGQSVPAFPPVFPATIARNPFEKIRRKEGEDEGEGGEPSGDGSGQTGSGQTKGEGEFGLTEGAREEKINEIMKANPEMTTEEAMKVLDEIRIESKTKSKNPTKDEVNAEISELSEKYNVPETALRALFMTESSYRQFDKNGKPLYGKGIKGNNTSATGISQITKETATTNNFNYEELKVNWKYNIRSGSKLYSKYFGEQFSVNKKVRQISVEAYSKYHQGPNTDGSKRGYYTDNFIKNYDFFLKQN